jgi:hypothetical protein
VTKAVAGTEWVFPRRVMALQLQHLAKVLCRNKKQTEQRGLPKA